MFDRVRIRVKGGDGGNGAITFRREKFIPYGGPDGGDGGDGGNVIMRADPSMTDLRGYRPMTLHKGSNGGNGLGNKKKGKNGADLVLTVPPGTIISQEGDSGLCVLIDLEKAGQEAVVAGGGQGGRGNARFTTSTSQAPHIGEKGEKGPELILTLEVRLIADVGIIGQPNVGKSSLLAAASAAKPKIADYPFTTVEPVLGVVRIGEKDSFVMAEIPGLIEGAHLGKGLGHEFLRHAMRTRLLVHLIDGTSALPGEDMIQVNQELVEFDSSLAAKPQILAVNKIDLPDVASRRSAIEATFREVGLRPRFISAATGAGVADLMAEVAARLTALEKEEAREEVPEKVFRPAPREPEIAVTKEDGVFAVTAPALERITGPQGESNPDLMAYVRRQLDRHGLRRELLRAGVKPGDKVRYRQLEWIWWE